MRLRTQVLIWLAGGIPLFIQWLDERSKTRRDWIGPEDEPLEGAGQSELVDEEVPIEHTHHDSIDGIEIHGDGLRHAHVRGDLAHGHRKVELEDGVDLDDAGWRQEEEQWVRA